MFVSAVNVVAMFFFGVIFGCGAGSSCFSDMGVCTCCETLQSWYSHKLALALYNNVAVHRNETAYDLDHCARVPRFLVLPRCPHNDANVLLAV